MKKLFIILLITAVTGAGLLVAGLAMGAKSQIYFDRSGIHANESKSQVITKKDTEPFNTIDIDMGSSKIEILPAEKYGFELSNEAGTEITYGIENGKLKIAQESRLNYINFGFGSLGRNYIKIYIPEDASMGIVTIKNSSGNLIINKLKCENLDINATSGNTDLNETTASLMNVHKSSGSINISNCNADKLDLILTSGSLKANNIHTKAMKLKLTSGNANVNGELLGGNEISLISGNVTLKIAGDKNEYNRDISVISGNVFIDGDRTKDDNFVNAQAKNSLKIDSTSGNVTVDFES